jgi:hypothetical protein
MGQERLLAVYVGHAPREGRVAIADVLERHCIKRARAIKRNRDSLGSEIIFGRAEAARADAQIATTSDLPHCIHKIIDPIADRSVTHNAKSHIGEPLREPRGVRVGYLACDNLIALGEDLSGRLITEHACR